VKQIFYRKDEVAEFNHACIVPWVHACVRACTCRHHACIWYWNFWMLFMHLNETLGIQKSWKSLTTSKLFQHYWKAKFKLERTWSLSSQCIFNLIYFIICFSYCYYLQFFRTNDFYRRAHCIGNEKQFPCYMLQHQCCWLLHSEQRSIFQSPGRKHDNVSLISSTIS
jgi:hypothetical protein